MCEFELNLHEGIHRESIQLMSKIRGNSNLIFKLNHAIPLAGIDHQRGPSYGWKIGKK